jgi:hypothetical protein
MKKIWIVMIVAAMAIAACGKKQTPAKPMDDKGSAMDPAKPGEGSAPMEGEKKEGETPPSM